ncbi:MAG: hypothetical protein LBM56_00230 [Burkholderiaceae bacterium]|jgi:DNA-directed RNA polymerase subunit RPC12/RpoP|nr:hypothetical protein [Burkholderiaceae bacterium]
MSFVKCKICGKDVLEEAARCPHCDSLGPKKNRRVIWMMVILVVILAVGMGALIYKRMQEKKRTQGEVEDMRRAEKIHQRIMSATFLLRTNVADPASVQVDDIRTNVDGSVLCYWYSARDSAGKPQKKKAVFAEGDFHYAPGSWDIYCNSKNLMKVPEKPPSED